MSGMLGGGNDITTSETRLGALRVQQSSQGVPIALMWGRNRVSPNLLWFDDFTAIEQRSSQSAGKGGGTTMTNVTYTYTASVLMGLCAGVCSGITAVWRNKDKVVATTKTLPSSQMTDTEILPSGKVITVPNSSRWASTVSVADSLGATISDYTVAAGVYTFGTTVSVGTVITIIYTISTTVQVLSAMQVAGLSQFGSGALGQAQWGYLTTAHPAQDIAYSGVTYVASANWLLGAAAGLPQLSFEIDGPAQVGGGNVDANPADIISDLLLDPVYGAGYPASLLDGLSSYRSWCDAAGLWFSPVWAERKGVFEYVKQMALLTHSRPLWSVNVLKLVPMATDALTSTTGSYMPAAEYSGPVYSLTDDDFSEPVEEQRLAPVDRFNRVSIAYQDRALDYAAAVESAEDSASIDSFGLIEAPDVVQANEIANQGVAATVCELLLREYMSEGSQYKFILPINYDLLEPLDIVQITDSRIDMSARSVRIIEIVEAGDDSSITVTAEDLQVTGSVTQASQAGSGFGYTGGPPDAVSVRAVMMPTAATGNAQQLWLGVTAGPNWGGSIVWVSSTGTDYRRIAEINVRARLGLLAGNLALASVSLNPVQVLDAYLTGSTQIASVSQVDADAGRSLVWVNGELMSYRDATLTAAGRYSLGYLRRALYGTTSPAHSAGDPWMRLDDSLAQIDVAATDIGTTLYIKVTSRNALGTYIQGLDEVTAIPITLTAQPSPPDAPSNLALTSAFVGTSFEINWGATARATDYQVEIRDVSTVLLRTIYTSATVVRYLYADAVTDGGAKRSYNVNVRGRDTGGNGAWATLAVSNPAPAITTGVAVSGSGTSRTISWTASTATDFAGYLARYSTTAGFDPTTGAGTSFYDGSAATATLTGLTVGVTYKVRVAAYDVWAKDIADLNWSTEYSFTA